ncbi:MAG: hypothetical protein ACD_49C00077G0008 [uncultured bacterium (gcode 4)]|uniref:DZANK-type domain-containing protein n=1 Tax=uncultured bacterium (gcode 4) TaxID=1234023 RepID=K2ACY3_9BACT|nr:MAG: hypothetical protein ACD_49C00077G0008 [uncultured bacterium (gcode 4)]
MDFVNYIIEGFVWFYELIISNITLDWIIKFAILYFFIIWWAFIIWVVKDITNRTTNILIQVLSILIVILFTPIFWLPIYLLIRPRTTIFEKYYEEETQLESEEEDEEIEEIKEIKKEILKCPHCNKHIENDFQFCPYCKEKLTKKCEKCNKDIKIYWSNCPYCGEKEKEEKKIEKTDWKEKIKVKVEKVEKEKEEK